jgi:hypothetical protein
LLLGNTRMSFAGRILRLSTSDEPARELAAVTATMTAVQNKDVQIFKTGTPEFIYIDFIVYLQADFQSFDSVMVKKGCSKLCSLV